MLTTGFGLPHFHPFRCSPPRVSSDVAALGSGPRGWNCPVRPADDCRRRRRSIGADRCRSVPIVDILNRAQHLGSGWRHLGMNSGAQRIQTSLDYTTIKLASWNIISTNGKDKVFGVPILWHIGYESKVNSIQKRGALLFHYPWVLLLGCVWK